MKTSPWPRGNEDVDDVDSSDHSVPHQVLKALTMLRLFYILASTSKQRCFYNSGATFFESKVNFLCWKFCWLACCCQWGILVRATPTRSEAHKLKLFLIKTWSAVQKHESPIYIKKRGVPQVYIWMANRRGCKEHWPEKKSNQNKEPCPVQMSNVAFKSFCRQIRQNARITVRVGLSSHSWQCQDFESVRYNNPPLRDYLLVTGLGASGCYCVEKD